MARRRWIAEEWSEGWAALTGAQARHLAVVLRAEPGTRYDVATDGRVWSAIVRSVSVERVEFTLEAELPADRPLPLTLLLAVFKFDRLEWAVEKATELGVARIVPVVARRTEKHLAQAAAARVERWRRIAGEAAKQSRRAEVPAIDDPLPLREALSLPWPGLKLLLAENERMLLLRDALEDESLDAASTAVMQATHVTMAVGPEGGWTQDEEQMFTTNGWTPVSLGPRILRAETVAIVGAAVVASVLR